MRLLTHLRRNPFSITFSNTFCIDFSSIFDPNLTPKIDQNLLKIDIKTSSNLQSIFTSICLPIFSKSRSPQHRKFLFSHWFFQYFSFSRLYQSSSIFFQFWSQLGSIFDPKMYQNLSQHGFKNASKNALIF